jgi:hypothetical protein
MAIFNSYVSLPEGKFYCKLLLLLTLFRLPGRQVRCDGVPDDLIMGCLDLWLGRVNFVCPKKSPNITSLQPWFSIGSIHFGGPYGGHLIGGGYIMLYPHWAVGTGPQLRQTLVPRREPATL